ncbi:hypothetical protein [Pseudoduganella aquatica]|uniref:hypothetical protein n=1 Tax=Pseudoduganella aquatica TaxID=2660641 RepID=UPI001E4D9034|nr:hypothetical protein [Pseudoduganella aquatica]
MTPEHDRREKSQATSETSGWHSLEYVVRQALEVQRDIGTPAAEDFLNSIGVNQGVIARVLGPEGKIRVADQQGLAPTLAVSDLPVSSPRAYFRHGLI